MEERLLLADHLQNKTFPADLADCKTLAHFSARCALSKTWGYKVVIHATPEAHHLPTCYPNGVAGDTRGMGRLLLVYISL